LHASIAQLSHGGEHDDKDHHLLAVISILSRGTGIRGLMRGMATLPQGGEQLVVRDNVGRPPGELGVSKSMECDIFPSVL